MNKKYLKTIAFVLAALCFCIVLLALVYGVIDREAPDQLAKSREFLEEIETPGKLWLNGYLGVFFRFGTLGNLNWLVLPLAAWFLATAGRRRQWRRPYWALAAVWLGTFLVIAWKGYFNVRYQLTLFPFTVTVVLLLTHQLLENKKKYLKILCFSALIMMCAYNTYRYWDDFRYFWDLKVSRHESHFPRRVVDFFNRRGPGGAKIGGVLVFKQPLFYYYVNRKGVDYNNPHYVELYVAVNQQKFNRRRMHQLLRRRYGLKYIFMNWSMENTFRGTALGEFLGCECRLLFNDNGYLLYEIRDRFLPQVLGASARRLPFPRLGMKPMGQRGQFNVKKIPGNPNRPGYLEVVNTAPGKNGQRILQLGYNLAPDQLKGASYIHLLVRVRVPPHLIDRDNYLFIQDLNITDHRKDDWERERLFFGTNRWRTYLLSKKIRPGSTGAAAGIRFQPGAPGDTLQVEQFQVYVSRGPL